MQTKELPFFGYARVVGVSTREGKHKWVRLRHQEYYGHYTVNHGHFPHEREQAPGSY